MNLPSFIWLWKIAAWAMGFSLLAYLLMAGSGIWIAFNRQRKLPHPNWLQPFHYLTGVTLILLVLVLLAIGLVGTLGHYGSLGHSSHLAAGLLVVSLVFLSAWSAIQIKLGYTWARTLHVGTNAVLLMAFLWVSLTGWTVVQKYLP